MSQRDPRYIPGFAGYVDDFHKLVEAHRNAEPDGPPSCWTPDYVGARLVAAVKAGGRRYGPKSFGSNWPTMVMEFSDLVDAGARANVERAREIEIEHDEDAINNPDEARMMAPGLVEEAISWPLRYLANDQRLAGGLIVWAMAQAGLIRIEPFLRRMKLVARTARLVGAITTRIGPPTWKEVTLVREWRKQIADMPTHLRAQRMADIGRLTSGFGYPTSKTSLHRYRKQALANVSVALERDRTRVR